MVQILPLHGDANCCKSTVTLDTLSFILFMLISFTYSSTFCLDIPYLLISNTYLNEKKIFPYFCWNNVQILFSAGFERQKGIQNLLFPIFAIQIKMIYIIYPSIQKINSGMRPTYSNQFIYDYIVSLILFLLSIG